MCGQLFPGGDEPLNYNSDGSDGTFYSLFLTIAVLIIG